MIYLIDNGQCVGKAGHHRFRWWLVTGWRDELNSTFQCNVKQNTGVYIKKKMNLKMMSARWWSYCFSFIVSTLNVRGQSYLGLTRSISWLLMPWLLTSPGHQQPWYWLCRICRPFSYLRKDFKYLCQINVEEWHKMQIYVYDPSEKISMYRVKIWNWQLQFLM